MLNFLLPLNFAKSGCVLSRIRPFTVLNLLNAGIKNSVFKYNNPSNYNLLFSNERVFCHASLIRMPALKALFIVNVKP